ncbi:MAG: putative Ig domain-containing protein, partial [Candidatus Methanomethylicia archaeon]|nr:putative Ig domain-containing protein [Candidatus Methanomethylicia archaeon]
MKNSRALLGTIFVSLMVLGIIAVPVMAETTARIWTDKADYSPEETVTIYGEGFQGKVNITVIRPDGTINDPANNIIGEWTVDTDENGAFETTYILDGIIGVYTVNAIDEGGNTATMTFTDAPKVGSVTVGAQSPNPVAPGSNATYTITVYRGSGGGSSGSFTADLSITTALPTGASATFSPNPVSFAPGDNNKTANLTITTSSSTPTGSYQFTVKAKTSASDYATGNGTLKIQEVNRPPVLTIPSLPSSIDEMVEWTFDADAFDPDVPPQTLTFSLVGAPEGASIDPSTGVFTWTPSEAQGPGTYTFNVTVSDGSLTDEKEITVTVNEVNRNPTLTLPSLPSSINEMEEWTFTATATDPDIP